MERRRGGREEIGREGGEVFRLARGSGASGSPQLGMGPSKRWVYRLSLGPANAGTAKVSRARREPAGRPKDEWQRVLPLQVGHPSSKKALPYPAAQNVVPAPDPGTA
jgi:hypothetical protein